MKDPVYQMTVISWRDFSMIWTHHRREGKKRRKNLPPKTLIVPTVANLSISKRTCLSMLLKNMESR